MDPAGGAAMPERQWDTALQVCKDQQAHILSIHSHLKCHLSITWPGCSA